MNLTPEMITILMRDHSGLSDAELVALPMADYGLLRQTVLDAVNGAQSNAETFSTADESQQLLPPHEVAPAAPAPAAPEYEPGMTAAEAHELDWQNFRAARNQVDSRDRGIFGESGMDAWSAAAQARQGRIQSHTEAPARVSSMASQVEQARAVELAEQQRQASLYASQRGVGSGGVQNR